MTDETRKDPVLTRRSIRKYTEEPVADEQVELLLRAAMAAPSAGNQQPWHFVVVRDRERLQAVTVAHPYASMLPGASLAILVCGDTGPKKWPEFWEQDCSAATENLLIEAERLGLGAVWLGVHPARGTRRRAPRALRPAGPRRAVRACRARPPGGAQAAVRPVRAEPRAQRALVGRSIPNGHALGGAGSLGYGVPRRSLSERPRAARRVLRPRPGAGAKGLAARVAALTREG